MKIFPLKTFYCLFFCVAIIVGFTSCNNNNSQNNANAANKKSPRPSFMSVKNIRFTEVRRTFNTGYSIGEQGYQVSPEWVLSFPSDDSVHIYNPNIKRFVNSPVTFDHDSIFNIAWSWLRLKKLSRDSIIFQVLDVRGKVINYDKSIMYMKLYADDYIKNKLHTTAVELKKPTRGDTLFIKDKTIEARFDTAKAFAALKPAVLTSKSPKVVVKRIIEPEESHTLNDPAEKYLSPEYDITIHKAYKDFRYTFSVLVDEKGKIFFVESLNYIYPEYREAQTRVMRGIVDGYLKTYLNVKPGTTLDIPHASKVIVHVTGVK